MYREVSFVGIHFLVGYVLSEVQASLLCVKLRAKKRVETVASVASVLEHANDVLVS